MSIPTSLIVVLLVVAWLVVLVPMIAKRRDKVPRTQSGGHGFRVLRRAQASLKRRPKRTSPAKTADTDAEVATPPPAPAEWSGTGRDRTLVTVGAPVAAEPQDAAEEWAAAHGGYPAGPMPHPADVDGFAEGVGGVEDGPDVGAPSADAQWEQPTWEEYPAAPSDPPMGRDDQEPPDHRPAQGTLWSGEDPAEPVESVTAFPHAAAPQFPDEVDEHEWAEHAAAASAPMHPHDDEALRPTPRRRGRGGYDPEAAEATRAFKYRQRRRVTMALAAATVLFTAVAFLLATWLWVGAAVSFVLLVLYLAYLRRQVKIEAQIRQRRMERLQRARQIRPEYGRGRPPVRAGRSAAGPGRRVVDLDDDDPGFDHLEPYEPPMTYRRAAGQ